MKTLRAPGAFVLAAACAFAQTSIPVTGTLTINGSLNGSSATATSPLKSGTATPATCSVPEMFFETDATAGQNIWLCTATNTWTQVTGGSGTPGGSSGQVQINSSGAFAGRALPGFTDNGTSLTPDGTVLGELGGNNTWTGHNYYPASTTQSITAVGNSVTCDRVTVAVSPTSNLTLTSAPTIADGTNGQLCTIVNVGSNSLTIQDQDTLASSNLQLSSSTVTIPAKGQLTLQFNSTIGEWIQYTGAGSSSDPNAVTAAGTLTSNLPMIGGGSKAAAVGTRSGNTTEFASSTGTKASGAPATWDANGNLVGASTFERRVGWVSGTTGNGGSVAGDFAAVGFGAGITGSGGSNATTQVVSGIFNFAGNVTTSWIVFRTPGAALRGTSTANISNMDVLVDMYKASGALTGNAAFRVLASCPNNTATVGSAITWTSPSWTLVTGGAAGVPQTVTFSNVLSGLTCGPNQTVQLQLVRGIGTDGDTETGSSIQVKGWTAEITR